MIQTPSEKIVLDEASRLFAEIRRTHDDMRSFLVTGCVGGEGATTFAMALARGATATGAGKALAIDADFVARGLTKLAQAEGRDGLRQIDKAGVAIADLVVAAGDGVAVLPAGRDSGATMAGLVGSGALAAFIDTALRDYRYLFWDSHALGRSADTGVLMTAVPNVILMTELDATRIDHFTSCLNAIANASATPVAVLRNRAGRHAFSVGA